MESAANPPDNDNVRAEDPQRGIFPGRTQISQTRNRVVWRAWRPEVSEFLREWRFLFSRPDTPRQPCGENERLSAPQTLSNVRYNLQVFSPAKLQSPRAKT